MKGADRVQAALKEAGLAIDVIELEDSARTAQLAADAIGAPLGSIVKSLVFLADEEPVLVLVAGDHRADTERLKETLGVCEVSIAPAERVREETGFSIGGVPPIGHGRSIATVIDRSLSRFETVYAAAGHPHAVFPISYEALVRVTGGRVADLVRG